MVPPHLNAATPESTHNVEGQGRQPGRRDRRRRDDAYHMGLHQGAFDPALSRHRPSLLRSRYRASRRHRRSGDNRCRPRHPGAWRGRQMRDDHARREAGRGVRPQANVALAQRHHSQHPRRHGVPRADHLPQCATIGAGLDRSHCHRPSRLWRSIPRHRLRGPRRRQADRDLHPGGWWRAGRARDLRVPRRWRRAWHVQPRRVDPGLRPRLPQFWSSARLAGLPVDQEHDPSRPTMGASRTSSRKSSSANSPPPTQRRALPTSTG